MSSNNSQRLPFNGMTDKQRIFIAQLWQERDTTNVQLPQLAEMTKERASQLIDQLLDAPRKATSDPQAPAQPTPEVPAGRYAVPNAAGELRFYVVSRPTEGRWAGRTFVSVQASDAEYPVKGRAANVILGEIAADPKAASVRYGQELGCCGVCGRTLTDEASRAAGIGPICAGRF